MEARTHTLDASSSLQQRVLRSSRLKLSSLLSIAHRLIAIVTSFFLVPFLTTKMGAARYGLWLTVSSLSAWLTLTDLGLGSALVNELAPAVAAGNREEESIVLAKHVVPIAALTGFVFLIFCALFPLIPWVSIITKSDNLDQGEVRATVFICFSFFLLNMFLGTIDRVYSAAQLLYRVTGWNIAANLVSFLVLVTAVTPQTQLPVITFYSVGVPVFLKLLNGVFLFGFERPWLRETIRKAKKTGLKYLLNFSNYRNNESSFFFVNQVISLIMLETDYLLISHLFGSGAVAVYAVSLRLSTTVFSFVSAYASPLWPAIAESKNQKDYAWMHKTFFSVRGKAMAVAAVAAVGLMLAGRVFVKKWTKGVIDPPTSLLLASGFYLLSISWCQLHAMLLNGLGLIKEQSKVVSLTAVSNLIFSYLLGRRYGLTGVCWGTSLSCLLSCIWYTRKVASEFSKHYARPNSAST